MGLAVFERAVMAFFFLFFYFFIEHNSSHGILNAVLKFFRVFLFKML